MKIKITRDVTYSPDGMSLEKAVAGDALDLPERVARILVDRGDAKEIGKPGRPRRAVVDEGDAALEREIAADGEPLERG